MARKLNCILLIDDDTEDNYFHQLIIDEMNITDNVSIAVDGVKALTFLKEDEKAPPDLIFLDINMPRMNGWEFLSAYNELENENKAKVIVVMLTTSTNPADRKKAGEFPEVTGFYSKPITEEMINGILERHFEGHSKALD